MKKQVFHNLMSVVRLHRKRVESTFADGELYGSQHRLLMDIARLLGPDRQAVLSQKELARHMEVTPATVAAALKKLERGGYIRKIMDADDNRYNHVEITPKGERVVTESRQTFDELEEDMLGVLSGEELRQLNEYLLRIKSAVRAKTGCRPAGAETGRNGCRAEKEVEKNGCHAEKEAEKNGCRAEKEAGKNRCPAKAESGKSSRPAEKEIISGGRE